jgi:flagellar motility protein MotE (MotC chaperone)
MKSLSGSAYAEEVKAEEKPAENAAEKPLEKPVEKSAEVTADAAPAAPPADSLKTKDEAIAEKNVAAQGEKEGAKDIALPSTGAASTDSANKDWQDASDTDTDSADIKKEMYGDLSKRRTEIEAKEKKLGEREALLEAAQKELDRKFKEMEGLRDEIKDLLQQQTAAEASRIQSLVKIYSGMKPKDAARIFSTLDTDILMDVVSNMPESKAAPIIALMEADRAKALTTLLAEQKKLPDVP